MVIKLDLAKAYDKMEWAFAKDSLEKINDILCTFSSCSGQTINKAKSCILFSKNTPPGVASSLSGLLGIEVTSNIG